jgi:hypothetical protein
MAILPATNSIHQPCAATPLNLERLSAMPNHNHSYIEPTKKPFLVEGVDDSGRTLLAAFDNSGEARSYLTRYTSREDAGGWDLIEVYDTRGDEAERLAYWERN